MVGSVHNFGHNNSQHFWEMLVWQMLDGAGSDVQPDARLLATMKGHIKGILSEGCKAEDFVNLQNNVAAILFSTIELCGCLYGNHK